MPPFATLVDLLSHLTTPVNELFEAYTKSRVTEFGQPESFLIAHPTHHNDFLKEYRIYVNFIAQHPELTNDTVFKYDYQRFTTGFDEIANATSEDRMALIHDVKQRLGKVCTHLNDIDPAADINMEPLNCLTEH